jgi:type IV secretory pathway VirB2 component (pilin)
MNPQDNRDYERRLQELETELDKDRRLESVETQPGQPLQRNFDNSQPAKSVFNQVVNWFNKLPSAGKVAVVIIAAVVGFSLLRSVLQLVASLISLAILGVILYWVYKFFVTPKS